jgi:long-chain acyl-CoA synthetase
VAGFDTAEERERLHTLVSDLEKGAQSETITAEMREQVLSKHATNGSRPMAPEVLEAQIRKNRARWLRAQLTIAGKERGATFGWPNTYTFTKSLAESLIASRAADLPVAIVRPSIVETSTAEPFAGWNEGVNTSAPLVPARTYFRRCLRTKECLDLTCGSGLQGHDSDFSGPH